MIGTFRRKRSPHLGPWDPGMGPIRARRTGAAWPSACCPCAVTISQETPAGSRTRTGSTIRCPRLSRPGKYAAPCARGVERLKRGKAARGAPVREYALHVAPPYDAPAYFPLAGVRGIIPSISRSNARLFSWKHYARAELVPKFSTKLVACVLPIATETNRGISINRIVSFKQNTAE